MKSGFHAGVARIHPGGSGYHTTLHSRWAYKLISYHPTTRSLCCLSTVDDRPTISHLLSRKTATVAPVPNIGFSSTNKKPSYR